jgi:glycosyltransferase involved in cell wall biosynthesis
MSQPKISYLVAVYNHEKFIKKTLDSLLVDCDCDCEILIIDDGSTDNSSSAIQDWISENKKLNVLYKHRNNQGAAQTLNDLIQLASGIFLRPVAGDDMVVNGSTKKLIEILENNPQLAAVFTDSYVIDENDRPLYPSALELSGGSRTGYETDVAKALILNWAVCGSCILWRKKIFLDHFGGYQKDICIEDWFMYLKLAARKSILFDHMKSCYYRIHSTNVSRTRDTNHRIKNLNSMLATIKLCQNDFGVEYKKYLELTSLLYQMKISYLQRSFARLSLLTLKYFFKKIQT